MLTVLQTQMLRSLMILVLCLTSALAGGCSAETSIVAEEPSNSVAETNIKIESGSIEIAPNSPADTVKEFYVRLREKRFREALHLTNIRPAIEGLTDDELKEFAVDFEAIAKLVPLEIQINGEIITGDKATVTAKLPFEDEETLEFQEIKLRKNGDHWVILSVDEGAEAIIHREGKNYFYSLKIETHQEEATKMLERISKAQLAFALQNDGIFADAAKLIELGYIPADIATAETTGYRYQLYLSTDRRTYYATATPRTYGKTGRLSFRLEPTGSGASRVTSKDMNGEILTK
ncbi:hypothetical protein BH24ACI3_BH24ACI3_01180 [soil metagenome]